MKSEPDQDFISFRNHSPGEMFLFTTESNHSLNDFNPNMAHTINICFLLSQIEISSKSDHIPRERYDLF